MENTSVSLCSTAKTLGTVRKHNCYETQVQDNTHCLDIFSFKDLHISWSKTLTS